MSDPERRLTTMQAEDLADRLERAARELNFMSATYIENTDMHTRLEGKRQGVLLALSYLREIHPQPPAPSEH